MSVCRRILHPVQSFPHCVIWHTGGGILVNNVNQDVAHGIDDNFLASQHILRVVPQALLHLRAIWSNLPTVEIQRSTVRDQFGLVASVENLLTISTNSPGRKSCEPWPVISMAANLGGREGEPFVDHDHPNLGGQEGEPLDCTLRGESIAADQSGMAFESPGGQEGEPVTGNIVSVWTKGIPTKDERIGGQGPLDRIIKNGKAVPADIDTSVVSGDVVGRQYLDGAGGEALRGGGSYDAALQ